MQQNHLARHAGTRTSDFLYLLRFSSQISAAGARTFPVTPPCDGEIRTRVALRDAAEKGALNRIRSSRQLQTNRGQPPVMLAMENMTWKTTLRNPVVATTTAGTTIPATANSTAPPTYRPLSRRAGIFVPGRRMVLPRPPASDGNEAGSQRRSNEDRVPRLRPHV